MPTTQKHLTMVIVVGWDYGTYGTHGTYDYGTMRRGDYFVGDYGTMGRHPLSCQVYKKIFHKKQELGR